MPNNIEGKRQPVLPDFFKDARGRFYSPGRDIYSLGERFEPYTIYGVVRGRVDLFTFRDEQEIRQRVIGPGGLFGLDDSVEEGRSQIARASSSGAIVARIVLTPDQLYGEDTAIRDMLLREMTQRVRDLTTTVAVDTGRDAQARVARVLQRFSVENHVYTTRGALAQDLGLDRRTVGEILQVLESAGVIKSRHGRIEILNVDKLSKRTER